jgi:hypothetical protein
MSGTGLLRILIEATGLPKESLEMEMKRVLSERGLREEDLTLEDLREVIASYLQEALLEAKDSVSP